MNQPQRFLKTGSNVEVDLLKNLNFLKGDYRPVEFSVPVYSPLSPQHITIVHTPSNPETGGFFDLGTTMRGHPHYGIDIGASVGTNVVSSEDGVVVRAEYSKSYGHVIYINHRDGYQTRYAHLSKISVVKGQKVLRGEMIGNSGKSGNANNSKTLPHMHFEIRKVKSESSKLALSNEESEPVDPIAFLKKTSEVKFYLENEKGNSIGIGGTCSPNMMQKL